MFASDFQRKLRTLNRNLRIYCGDDGKPAGLYLQLDSELVHICGVDRNELDRFTHHDVIGHIVHSGWLRVVKILVAQKLVDKRLAQRVFRTDLNVREPVVPPAESAVTQLINEALARGAYKGENYIHNDAIPEIAHAIRQTQNDEVREKADRLKHWAKKVGIRRA